MKLSIITINYNNDSGLKRTIESVLNQSYNDFEYIVIDGGSSDSSRELIEYYQSEITHWVSEPDTGIYNAMNKGIRAATGEYLLFLNSGDVLFNSQAIESFLSSTPSADIVSCAIEVQKDKPYIMLPPTDISFFTLHHNSLAHQATFIKKSLFSRVGFYREEYRIMSDWCFFVEALLLHQCSYEYRDIVLSKFDTTGISSTSCEKEHFQSILFLNKMFPRFTSDYCIDEYIYNTAFFLKKYPYVAHLLFLPARIVNRIFRLRSRLRKRMSQKI